MQSATHLSRSRNHHHNNLPCTHHPSKPYAQPVSVTKRQTEQTRSLSLRPHHSLDMAKPKVQRSRYLKAGMGRQLQQVGRNPQTQVGRTRFLDKMEKTKQAYSFKDKQKKLDASPQPFPKYAAHQAIANPETAHSHPPKFLNWVSSNQNSSRAKMSEYVGEPLQQPQRDTGMQRVLLEAGLPAYLPVPAVAKMREEAVSPSLGAEGGQGLGQSIGQQHNQLAMRISVEWVRHQYKARLPAVEEALRSVRLGLVRYEEGVYVGEHDPETQHKQGVGVIFYKGGKVFEGTFHLDRKEGPGYEHYPDGSNYLGHFHSGLRHGRGRFQWGSHEVYDGEWLDGRKHGSGMWTAPGLSYVGEWRHDLIEGMGVLTEQTQRSEGRQRGDGSQQYEGSQRYEGEFKQSMKWGKGSCRLASGDTYTGMFARNLPNGQGHYLWVNGDTYTGAFVNGLRHGHGQLATASLNYAGDFRNDKKTGHGEEHYADSLAYVGNFLNDLRHGWGILYQLHLRLFEGYWLNNQAVDTTPTPLPPVQEEPNYSSKVTRRQRLVGRQKYVGRQRLAVDRSKLAFKVFRERPAGKEQSMVRLARECCHGQ